MKNVIRPNLSLVWTTFHGSESNTYLDGSLTVQYLPMTMVVPVKA